LHLSAASSAAPSATPGIKIRARNFQLQPMIFFLHHAQRSPCPRGRGGDVACAVPPAARLRTARHAGAVPSAESWAAAARGPLKRCDREGHAKQKLCQLSVAFQGNNIKQQFSTQKTMDDIVHGCHRGRGTNKEHLRQRYMHIAQHLTLSFANHASLTLSEFLSFPPYLTLKFCPSAEA
jgi:hypothetical protein